MMKITVGSFYLHPVHSQLLIFTLVVVYKYYKYIYIALVVLNIRFSCQRAAFCYMHLGVIYQPQQPHLIHVFQH